MRREQLQSLQKEGDEGTPEVGYEDMRIDRMREAQRHE